MQWLRGKKVLIGALAVLACTGDPTGNEGTPTEITAQPEVLFVTQGDSQPVIVTAIDEDGQALVADFTLSNVGSGIQVAEDPTYLHLDSENQIGRQARFFVKGIDLVATTFTLNALGLTKDVSVTTVPGNLAATISNTTPALGDTISITAPTGTVFNASSALTLGGLPVQVVSQDASTIVAIPGPNMLGPAVVSDVGVTSNPNLLFTLSTPDTVRVDSILDIGANVAPTNPALGGAVTLTLPAGLRLLPESLATLSIEGTEVPPRDAVLSADSSTITFVPPPNADSVVAVSGVVPQRLAACCGATEGYALRLNTTVKVTTPVVDSIPATLSSTTPALGQEVTLTRTDAAFSFDPDAAVTVGGLAGLGQSVAADGSSITFVPPPGATGNVSVDGVTVAGFSLALPSKTPSMTVPPATPIAGTESPATAPALTVPAPGGTTRVFDDAVFSAADITADGGVGAQYYKITVGAPTTLTISISSSDGGPDLDGVVCLDGTCADPDQQDFSLASVAHDESSEVDLPAGTHTLAVVNFDGAPTDFVLIEITR
jgi:hypothetical protein